MPKELTVKIDEEDLESAYAVMARDKQREQEALEWAELTTMEISLPD